MDEYMTQADEIRTAFRDLRNVQATAKEIKKHCKKLYGYTPSSQAIYSAIGSETERQMVSVNGAQIRGIKSLVDKLFNGDWDLAIEGIYAGKSIVSG